jgi:hypothetical protein
MVRRPWTCLGHDQHTRTPVSDKTVLMQEVKS